MKLVLNRVTIVQNPESLSNSSANAKPILIPKIFRFIFIGLEIFGMMLIVAVGIVLLLKSNYSLSFYRLIGKRAIQKCRNKYKSNF